MDHYSHVKRPLTELTKKDVKWTWGEAEEEAFQQIKKMLVSALVLRNPDWTRPFILHTDWSKAGVGACLSQIADDGQEYAVAFASRMNSRAEYTFSSYEGEVSTARMRRSASDITCGASCLSFSPTARRCSG